MPCIDRRAKQRLQPANTIEACRSYSHERGYTVAAEFAEEFTGARLDRPELNKLRELVGQDSINAIIVYDLDRLARKSVYQMLIEEEFNRQGANVEYVNGQYEDSDEGRLQKQIKSSIAEYEKAKILERSKRGKFGKAKSGFVVVGPRPPYGYAVKSEPHKAWLEVNEEEAQIVRLVYQWYLRGKERGSPLSIRGVAKELCALQIPTRGDKFANVAKKQACGVWAPATVIHILKNEAYAGIWYYGKTKMISDGKESTRTPKPKCGLGKQVAVAREDWIAVNVPHIIERTDWEAAQARMKANKRILNGRPANNPYLLSRRLRCSRCGYGVRGQVIMKKHFYYHCNGKRQLVARCDLPSFRGDWVDAAVWQWVKDLLQNPRIVAEGLRNSQSEIERANRAVRERQDIVEAQLAESKAQLAKVLDLYLAGEFPKEMLVERKARLEQTVRDLAVEHADMSKQSRPLSSPMSKSKRWKPSVPR